jgi:O-antigen ligase
MKRVAAGALLGLAVLMIVPGYVTSTTDSNRSAQHRIDMWAEGIEMARFHPVLGIGKGNFKYYTSRLIAHNSMIEIMGETGFVGLFLWLGIIYMGLKKLLMFVQQPAVDSADKTCANAVGLSLIGYLLSAMFVTLEYETFYVLLAMSAVVGRALPEPAQFTGRDAFAIGSAIIVFFVVFKAIVMTYY